MIEGHLYFFPISVCVLIPLASVISFVIAVRLGHSQFDWPSLSQSSNASPESCIYSQLLNAASFLLVITVYIRYRQIAELIRNNPTCGVRYSRSKTAFLLFGLLAAFGLSLIANFPHANVYSVRLLATYLTFIASVGALHCEMLLSLWIRPLLYSTRTLPVVRTVIAVVGSLALVTFLILQTITVIKYDRDDKLWTPAGFDWNYHFSTTVSTWVLTTCLLLYTTTLAIDFRRIKIISPKIFLTDDVTDEQNTLSLSI